MNKEKITINNQELGLIDLRQKLKNASLTEWESKIYQFIINWFNDDFFILQKTSGSTGAPKEIKLNKSAMTASATSTINFFQLKEKDTAWLCLPIDYIAGKMMVVRAIIGNMNLLITEPKGTPGIPQETINFTAMVPLQVKNLMNGKANFANIKKLIIGGAEVDYFLSKALQNIETEVFATYGMTETCSHIALQRINGDNPDKSFRAFEGITISKNDEGCLTIFAPDFLEKKLQTNDLIEIISPGEFRLLGRIDHIINSGGLKISPEQLEEQIKLLINHDVVIIPQQNELLGQRIILVIEGSQNNFDTKKLLAEISTITGKHFAPKSIVFVDQIPRTTSMKIDRNILIEQLSKF